MRRFHREIDKRVECSSLSHVLGPGQSPRRYKQVLPMRPHIIRYIRSTAQAPNVACNNFPASFLSSRQVAATVGQGGDTLVDMVTALSLQEGSTGGRFFATEPGKPDSSFSGQAVSVEAQDEAKGKRLWELSAGCVGLGSKTPI